MKLFWRSLMLFCVFSHQNYREVTAGTVYNTLVPYPANDYPKFTGYQTNLLDEFSVQLTKVLKHMNAPYSYDISLDDDDPPLLQNCTYTFEDEAAGGGFLRMYNVAIDGLTDLEDHIHVVRDKLEIRISVKVKQITIHGECTVETYAGIEETAPCSVVLDKVRLGGIISMLVDPDGNIVITKAIPSICNEAAHVSMKTKILQNGPLLQSVHTILQNAIQKRLIRIAQLEITLNYPRRSPKLSVLKTNWTVFEAQKLVNQQYDPYKLKRMSIGEPPAVWHVGPFYLRGFSNFRLDDMDILVSNTSVDIILRILTDGVFGKFPFTFQQRMGEYNVERMEFLAKIKLTADGSATPPILDALGYELTNCKVHLTERLGDKTDGTTPIDDKFDQYSDGIFCLLIKNEITTANMIRKIQTDLLNEMETSELRNLVKKVYEEDRLMSEAY